MYWNAWISTKLFASFLSLSKDTVWETGFCLSVKKSLCIEWCPSLYIKVLGLTSVISGNALYKEDSVICVHIWCLPHQINIWENNKVIYSNSSMILGLVLCLLNAGFPGR